MFFVMGDNNIVLIIICVHAIAVTFKKSLLENIIHVKVNSLLSCYNTKLAKAVCTIFRPMFHSHRMKGGAKEREGKEDSTTLSSNRTKTRLYLPAQISSMFFI